MDREKVMTWLEICGKNNDCSGCCPYSENGFGEYCQCSDSLMADAYDLLKEQEGTINELQNAYGYLQKQFFEAQDKLLKEQEAVKPKSKIRHGANAQIQHFCGNCNTMLHGKPKFCSECGKGVLW